MRFGLNPKWQTDNKFGAFSLLGLNLNGAAHHLHNVLGNGHAQSCALNFAHGGGALSLKGGEYLLRKFLAHSDSVILYPDFVQRAALYCLRELLQPDGNGSACGSKLDRIGQKIQQHLVQPRFIAVNILVGHIHGIHIKFQLLCVDLPADNGFQVVEHIRKTDRCFLQMNLSGFNAAHIQNIIDQRKQMVAGGKNLPQIIPHPLRVVDVAQRQCGKADNGIHGGADVVGHIGKEGAFCLARGFCHMDCLCQRLIHFPVSGAV